MDEIEKNDSNREPAINDPARITYGDKKDLIIAGVFIFLVVLGVIILLGGGVFILSTMDVGKLQAAIWPTSTPQPTATPVPTATPLPNPQQHPGDILYASTFDSPGDWYVGHTENNYTSDVKYT